MTEAERKRLAEVVREQKSGLLEATPYVLKQMGDAIDARMADIDARFPALVTACDEETRLAVTAWVFRHVCDHAREGGTFRYLIYDRLGFGTDAYVPLYLAGGMDISNEFELKKGNDDGETGGSPA